MEVSDATREIRGGEDRPQPTVPLQSYGQPSNCTFTAFNLPLLSESKTATSHKK